MKPRPKTFAPCHCMKMGLLMRFLFLTFVGRAVAFAVSIASPETSNTTRASLTNGNSGAESNNSNSRTSRSVLFESNASPQVSDGAYLEEGNEGDEFFMESTDEEVDKRSIPMMRFGRSGASVIPSVRFGRSDESVIPGIRFGRSGSSAIPAMRFGKSQSSVIPSIRFGRSESSVIPSIRFGRSESSVIPSIRFGRSDASMIPTVRFGRSESSAIPSMRFGRSGYSAIPTMRFGRSSSSAIPAMRFGRSGSSVIPSIRFGRSSESMIPSVRYGRTDNSMIPSPRFGRSFQNTQSSDEDNEFEDLDSIAEHEDQNSDSNESEMDSNETGLNFINRNTKRESNESLIPQIRYGRSALKAKITKEVKPQYFSVPNIRPGRSSKDYLNTPEETNEPYISDVQGFLGLFGAFRRSDDAVMSDSQNLQDMELGKKVEDFLLDANADNAYKNLEKQSLLSNQDTLYVIPYPRPGKRQLKMYPSTQKNIENTKGMSSQSVSKVNKIADFLVPYPRPGKKLEGALPLNYAKSQKTASVLPYPRPGRSKEMLPYPRPGKSTISLPYPRPGRSPNDVGPMIPYPRYGKSKYSFDSQSENKKSAQDHDPTYLLNPLLSEKIGNFKKHNPQEINNNPIFMLPYPRPGRDI
ncbi:hypothetical protein JTE90_004225 [Oedothorax gibbosus]|uniref:Uncharacterized protein n=1 Tax=Oedothorax gibbosus TaxID=931172 RepID=A0AAV6URI4_9ARAC|nr:hypothetical protein JTE90_004225 [Oedothorax gibbosus]